MVVLRVRVLLLEVGFMLFRLAEQSTRTGRPNGAIRSLRRRRRLLLLLSTEQHTCRILLVEVQVLPIVVLAVICFVINQPRHSSTS